MPSASGTVLAFDYGTCYIGVAVGQTLSRSATALTTLMVRDGRLPWDQIAVLVQTWEPDALVVGLPWHADGSEHELAPQILRFSRQLAGRYACPVHKVNEYLSSYEAQGRQRAGQSADLDAIAAQVILETWWSMQPTEERLNDQ